MSLVSLVGAGGCGKTRLSLQVAAEILDSFPDGVWFLELAPLNDPALIPQIISTALGLAEQPGRSILTTLSAYLCTRQLLLVLDNCEHLVEECARLADILLQASNELQILITSREAFGIRGETTFRVPSLTLPEPGTTPEVELLPGYEGISLFKERAIESNPTFAITHQNAGAVVELCSRLDGIPLAIELAAARIKVLTVEQIVARLDDRFRLLTGGSRTALPRQQTLHALIDWSYDLLSPAEKRLLSYLSIFAGGWSLPAAVAICETSGNNQANPDEFTILDTLTGLVNKSLVQVADDLANAETRYFFLETIRQYGLEKLKASGEVDNVRQRHLTYYASQAQELELKLQGQQQLQTIKWLDRELDNLRVAIDNALKLGQFEAIVYSGPYCQDSVLGEIR